jgi:toxin ParE1/3/4
MGNRSYRQLFFKPYRILYRIRANTVYIALIADGRRDMKSLLLRRLTDR